MSSAVVNLNWLGAKPTTAIVMTGSSGSSDFIQQCTLDDVQKVAAASAVRAELERLKP